MVKAWDIIGYTFRADVYCPSCIIAALPTGDGEAFDGWALAPGARPMSPEDNLSEIAYVFGIDRIDEHTFDSDDFPKVIFESSVDSSEFCASCNVDILGG